MTITTTLQTIYRTTDGSIFEDYDLAVKHELTRKVQVWALAHYVHDTGSPDHWIGTIVKYRESLAEILNSVEPVIVVPPPTYSGNVSVTTYEVRSDGTGAPT